jgi:hypothetical protein
VRVRRLWFSDVFQLILVLLLVSILFGHTMAPFVGILRALGFQRALFPFPMLPATVLFLTFMG